MRPLYEDPHFTFRFADDRIIPRFHLEGVEAGQHMSVFRIDPGTGQRLGLLATATVGEGGCWAVTWPRRRHTRWSTRGSRPAKSEGVTRLH
jgi:hypothetical protein